MTHTHTTAISNDFMYHIFSVRPGLREPQLLLPKSTWQRYFPVSNEFPYKVCSHPMLLMYGNEISV